MSARPDRTEIMFIVVMSIVVLILIAMAITPVRAMEPEDIRIESNGTRFQYGDVMKITIYGENNTTYRFFIEDKGYLLRMYYLPIWCNWSGIGKVSWVVNDSLQPRWHLAYIKLPNVTSNPTIEFKIDIDEVDLMNWFDDTSGEIKTTDKEEGFWNDFRITSVLVILVIVNFIVIWKKIIPHKVRVGKQIYDKKLGVMVRPFREYTILERLMIGIANKVKWGHTKHKMRRKQSKTPYHTRNIEGDINPPEKMKQKLDSKRRYLTKLEAENKALVFKLSDEKNKLEALRSAPDIERDIQAIHMKENEILKLRENWASVGTKINDTKKDIKIQEPELKKLYEEERKGVFIK